MNHIQSNIFTPAEVISISWFDINLSIGKFAYSPISAVVVQKMVYQQIFRTIEMTGKHHLFLITSIISVIKDPLLGQVTNVCFLHLKLQPNLFSYQNLHYLTVYMIEKQGM